MEIDGEVSYVGLEGSFRKEETLLLWNPDKLWRFGTIWPDADVTFLPIPWLILGVLILNLTPLLPGRQAAW